MPIYEFHCNRCNHEFEKLVLGPSEKALCPKCRSKKVTRVLSAFAFSVGGKFKSTASTSCSSCSSSSCSGCSSK